MDRCGTKSQNRDVSGVTGLFFWVELIRKRMGASRNEDKTS